MLIRDDFVLIRDVFVLIRDDFILIKDDFRVDNIINDNIKISLRKILLGVFVAM